MQSEEAYDVVVIGAGIVGCLVAREFSRYRLSVVVLEKAWDVGTGASGANSAILHSGCDPKPGTLKARLNVEGNRLWESLSRVLDVPMKRTGSYVVAVGREELPALDTMMERAIRNGVPGVSLVTREEMRIREPLIHPSVAGALYTPSAGVIDPFRAVVAAAESAAINGVKFRFGTETVRVRSEGGKVTAVETGSGELIRARIVVSCAGIHSDTFFHASGVYPDFTISPRKGEYLIFDPAKLSLNHVYFPVPTEKGKGCLVSTTTHGNVMIGPNANSISDREDASVSADGMDEIVRMAKKLIPSVDPADAISEFAGIRATGNLPDKDFLIEFCRNPLGLVILAGIDSPGLVSAPAIARYALTLVREAGFPLEERRDWIEGVHAAPVFHKLSHREKAELIEREPLYGRIVCRCEEITEGEVVAAIRSPVPATTYDAVKRRTWLGTGRCQGGFDYPRVIEILARELGIPVTEVTKKGPGSRIVFRETRPSLETDEGAAR
jgi:glycerol-3-phosphate dehydrogenase